ncbi:hypothetical protein I79_000399 [Cricetulus griseus]|uniref:Uncharacterized protein n=1 Tax=Cricetulus griseus TaxID=10029 RepID=G3GS84_CRIGR|nr:hypothetical protein I79_000399 [Cricetulus griseus]
MIQAGSDIARRLRFKGETGSVFFFPSALAPVAGCDQPARRDANRASDKVSLIKYIGL